TVMPAGPSSVAAERLSDSRAFLVAQYEIWSGAPEAASVEMLTMRPQRALRRRWRRWNSAISSAGARVLTTWWASRLAAVTVVAPRAGPGRKVSGTQCAALLTRISTGPRWVSAWSKIA